MSNQYVFSTTWLFFNFNIIRKFDVIFTNYCIIAYNYLLIVNDYY